MCRETEVERHLGGCGTGIDALLPSVHRPSIEKGVVVGVRSPKPPNNEVLLSLRLESATNSDKDEQERVLNGRESVHRPVFPRKIFAQSPRLLPYFPKPGVTSPPPPQSLARNPEPAVVPTVPTLSPIAPSKSTVRNPSPGPASRKIAQAQSPSTASKPTRNPSPAPASRATPRNPSPAPASRNSAQVPSSVSAPKSTPRNPSPVVSRTANNNTSTTTTRGVSTSSSLATAPASNATARNPSQTPISRPAANPTPATKLGARNPSPTPAPRVNARNPSPNPVSRSSARNPSPAPASRGNARPASPKPSSPASTAGVTKSPSTGNAVVPSKIVSTRSGPVRKDSSRPVLTANGSGKFSTAEAVRKTLVVASSPPTLKVSSIMLSPDSTLDLDSSFDGSLDRSLNKFFRKEGPVQYSPDSPTFSIKKPTPAELQAIRKERISGYGRKAGTPKAGRVACEGMLPSSPVLSDFKKRCHWVTPQSEPDLVAYHDEEWGVPVHDDKLLFELLVLEGAQAELSRPQILSMRDYFRDVLGGFDPEVVATFDEKKIAALRVDDVIRQPEAKLRGVIDNARQILKIQQEFGSFDKYLWNFVGFKPIVNQVRIFTQTPVKSSKSETLSKDLMRRGFRYVGPTTVYSFMQAAGMVNDHLVSCYRHAQCCAISQMQTVDSCSNSWDKRGPCC